VVTSGCSGKEAKKTPLPQPSQSADVDTYNGPAVRPGATDFCSLLKANQQIMGVYRTQVSVLCDQGGVTKLRGSDYFYTGQNYTTPNIDVIATESTGNVSQMQVKSGMGCSDIAQNLINFLLNQINFKLLALRSIST